MTKYKVFNNNNFNIGIRYENQPNREQIIRAKSFVLMEEDDIYYVDSASTLFKKGIIFLEDEDMLEKMGYTEKNPNTISEKEIKEIFRMSNGKMKAELKKLDAKHAFDKVIDVARKTDLPQSKLKIISDVIPNIEVSDLVDEETS